MITAGGPARGADPRFERFSRATLPEEIANRLLALIRGEELRPGDKLPAERELAQMMGVSRPVLREALRALSLMRVVDIRHGDGTYIAPLAPEQLIAHLDFVFARDSVALATSFEARRVVETGNVRLAAARISEGELVRLEGLVDALGAAIDDADRFGELDLAFHGAISDAARNFLLSQFMSIIDTVGTVSRRKTGALRAVRETAYRDHQVIFDSLRDHDEHAAEAAMRDHLDHIEQALQARAPVADARDAPLPADGGTA